MKISDLELFLVELPCAPPWLAVRSLVVRLSTDLGIDGWGEMPARWRRGELAARRHTLLSALAGRSVCDIEELSQLDVLRAPAVRSAVEMACWDAVGRLAQQPLYSLLGGLFRQHVPVASRLPDEPADLVPAWSRELAEQGFQAQVVSSGGHADLDLQMLRAVRELVGERAVLFYDCRRGFCAAEARQLLDQLEPGTVSAIIDPLRPADASQLPQFMSSAPCLVGIGRDLRGAADLLQLARQVDRALVVVALDQVGGLHAVRKCAAVAEAAGMVISLVQRPTSGITTAAWLQLAGSLPCVSMANECAYHLLQDDLLEEPLVVTDGMLPVPQAPGLGIEVDRARLERYQVA